MSKKNKLPKGYTQVYDNQEHFPVMREGIMRCCDCGLEHKVDFRVYEVLDRQGQQITIVPLESSERYQVGITTRRV